VSASGRAVRQEVMRWEAAAGGHEAGGCSGMRAGARAVPQEAGAGAAPWEAQRDSPTREVPSRSSCGLPCLLLVGLHCCLLGQN